MTEQQATDMRQRYANHVDVYMVGVYRINSQWCVYVWRRHSKKPTIYRVYIPAPVCAP